MTLTHAHVKTLRQPFTPEAVKWRADQKTPDRGGNVRCLAFIDARLAMERISEVDPAWTSRTQPSTMDMSIPECFLTIHGVTRSDVGATAMAGQNRMKALWSDAFKRAAVAFHVGAYLYALPVFKVDERGYWKKQGGDVGGLTPEGVKQLRQQYAKVVNHQKFQERFGKPIDHGDVADDERSAEPEESGALFDGTPATHAKGQPVQSARKAVR
jgi:hypothetical protein